MVPRQDLLLPDHHKDVLKDCRRRSKMRKANAKKRLGLDAYLCLCEPLVATVLSPRPLQYGKWIKHHRQWARDNKACRYHVGVEEILCWNELFYQPHLDQVAIHEAVARFKQFPGAKFITTRREMEAMLDFSHC